MDRQRQARLQFLLHKYVANNCSSSELDELFRILKENPDNDELPSIIDLEAAKINLYDQILPEEVSHSILLSLNKRLSGRNYQQEKDRKKSFFKQYLKIAAVLLIGIVCAGIAYLYSSVSSQHEYIEIKTAYGEIRHILLPDSSVVVLNSHSSIRYPAEWDDTHDRHVNMNGEVFFNVVHTLNNQKFSVHTDKGVTVEVLGTEFNVNNRRSRTQVVLQSGKIRLAIKKKDRKNENIVMKSGEYVEVSNSNETITKKVVDARTYTSWQNKTVVFNETSLKDILQLMEDNYGIVSLVNDSTILQEKFTATYPAEDGTLLARALEKSFSIKFNSERKQLVVGSPKKTSSK